MLNRLLLSTLLVSSFLSLAACSEQSAAASSGDAVAMHSPRVVEAHHKKIRSTIDTLHAQ